MSSTDSYPLCMILLSTLANFIIFSAPNNNVLSAPFNIFLSYLNTLNKIFPQKSAQNMQKCPDCFPSLTSARSCLLLCQFQTISTPLQLMSLFCQTWCACVLNALGCGDEGKVRASIREVMSQMHCGGKRCLQGSRM